MASLSDSVGFRFEAMRRADVFDSTVKHALDI